MEFPEPVIHVAIEPKTKSDQESSARRSSRCPTRTPPSASAPTRRPVRRSSPAWASCTSRCSSTACRREFGVEAAVGKPQVAYRETITKAVSNVEYRHIKQSGGSGQFAVVKIDFEPNPGGGYEFEDKISGGKIPREYINPTNQGLQSSLDNGVLAGYPTVDVKVSLVDGQYHDVDSSEMAFKIAGQMAFRKAAEMAKPVLMEPIMSVEVVTPEEYMGDVIGDLSSRRRRIGSVEARATPRSSTPRCRCPKCSVTVPTSVPHPGASHLHDAVLRVPAGARDHRPGNREAGPWRVIAAGTTSPTVL